MPNIAIDLSQLITAEDKTQAAERDAEETKRQEAMTYLVETDWMITRLSETGKAVPQEVLDNRQAARDVLST